MDRAPASPLPGGSSDPQQIRAAIFEKFFASGLNIPYDDLKDWKLLGKGRTAKVFRASLYGSFVAVKIPRNQLSKQKENASLFQEIFLMFLKEGIMLKTIQHENVCRFIGVCIRPMEGGMFKIMLVTEYLEGGNLQTMITNGKSYSLTARMRMARDIVKGMIYVHQHGVTHHDLKPDNLMLGAHNIVKVVDFGFAEKRVMGAPATLVRSTPKGSPLWMAPEVMLNLGDNERSDVYSWGLIVWQLITREKEPFCKYNQLPYEQGLQMLRENVALGAERPRIPDSCLPRIANLLRLAWQANPNDRPSFLQIDGMFDEILRESEIEDENQRIDALIRDEHGRIFWKKHFLGRTSCPWDEFSRAFFEFLNLGVPDETPPLYSNEALPAEPTDEQIRRATPQQLEKYNLSSPTAFWKVYNEFKRRDDAGSLRALKLVLLSQRPAVGIEWFGKVCALFGPLLEPVTFFFKIKSILMKEWFYNDLSKEQSYSALVDKPPGTFLVRISANPMHIAVISMVYENFGVIHILVEYDAARGFFLQVTENVGHRQWMSEFPRFPSLETLVEHYIQHGPLKHPCTLDWKRMATRWDGSGASTSFFWLNDAYLSNVNDLTDDFKRLLTHSSPQTSTKRTFFGAFKVDELLEFPNWVASILRLAAAGTYDLATQRQRAEHLCVTHSFRQASVTDDYNCLFNAVSDQLYNTLAQSPQIRVRVLDWLRHSKDHVWMGQPLWRYFPGKPEDWDTYCDNVQRVGVWADHLSLVAIAEIFRIRVLVLSTHNEDARFVVQVSPSSFPAAAEPKTILLLHWGDWHFDSLRVNDQKRTRGREP